MLPLDVWRECCRSVCGPGGGPGVNREHEAPDDGPRTGWSVWSVSLSPLEKKGEGGREVGNWGGPARGGVGGHPDTRPTGTTPPLFGMASNPEPGADSAPHLVSGDAT